MPSFNRIVLVGRLTRDPEVSYTSSNLAVAKFSIAVDRRFKGQDGQRQTDFFDCRAFRQTAEFMQTYVQKGRMVIVEGRIEFNESTGQDGQKRKYTNVICDNVETLDSQRDAQGGDAPTGGAFAGGGNSGGGRQQAAPEDNGYYAEDEPSDAPPPRRGNPNAQAQAPAAQAPAAQGRGGAGAPARGQGGAGAANGAPQRNAPAAAATPPARGAAKPAPNAYPEDDFDDSDPFADE